MRCEPHKSSDPYLLHIQHLLPDTWEEVENVNMLIRIAKIVTMLIQLKMS